MNNKGLKICPLVLVIAAVVALMEVNGSITPCKCKVKYVKKGCYYDPGSHIGKHHQRPLKELLINFRGMVKWGKGWNDYLRNLTCRCAELVRKNGYQYFGLQFYGECWSGTHSSNLFDAPSKKCWGHKPGYDRCDLRSTTECIGQAHHNYVYEVTSEVPEGCASTKPPPTNGPTPQTPTPNTKPPTSCNSRPCQNGGDCINLNPGYLCDCPNDFGGINCEFPK